MANLLEKTRKITSILKRTDEQLQVEMPYNDIAQQLRILSIVMLVLLIAREPFLVISCVTRLTMTE